MTLPAILDARLPASYERAKSALAECSQIDECLNWADKAEALASYARQAKDDQLRELADRIQGRAIRRAGELLKQIEPSKGGYSSLFHAREGDHPSITRTQAANDAGMSEHQRKQALRVATIPASEFEALIESDKPPTVTALAEKGTRKLVDLGDVDPGLFARATQVGGQIRRFAEMCDETDPREIAGGFKTQEVASIRRRITAIDGWLDVFIVNLGGE